MKFFDSSYPYLFMLVALALAGNSLGLELTDHVRTVAITGDAAPGQPGEQFSQFHSITINGGGRTAFQAQITDNPIPLSFAYGVWKEGPGLNFVVHDGDEAPGSGGATFGLIYQPPHLSDRGDVTFFAGASTPARDDGIWSEGATGLELIALERGASPAPSLSFTDLPIGPRMNDRGDIAFQAELRYSSHFEQAILKKAFNGPLEIVAHQRMEVPGFAPGTRFGLLAGAVLNDRGDLAMVGNLAEADGGSIPDTQGIWLHTNQHGLQLIAMQGASVDGLTLSRHISDVGLNDRRDVLFTTQLEGAGVDDKNAWGLFVARASQNVAIIARQGETAPGTSAPFGEFRRPVINARGEVAFVAELQDTDTSSDLGIWAQEGPQGMRLIAREGDHAPGTPPHVVFSSFPSAGSIVLNSLGQAAFHAFLRGDLPGQYDESGIWAEDVDDQLQLIVRTGDTLNVSDDPLAPDFRVVEQLSFVGESGNQDGRASGFNDRGELAFVARFTDGTQGVFVSHAVAVPEPRSLVLVIFLLVGAALANRR